MGRVLRKVITFQVKLKQNFPDIYVIVVLKHPDEWDSYSEEVKLFLIVSYQTCLDSERFFTPMYINLMES